VWLFIAWLDPNWELDDDSLKSTMESVETNGNMQIVGWRWGVPITSLHNHMYGIAQSQLREGK
jgi:hypothetical protein